MKVGRGHTRNAGPRYLSTEDVLTRFGISRFTLRRWHEGEKVGFPKPTIINRRHYYREAEVIRWELRQQGLDPDGISEVNGLKAASDVITDYDSLVIAMRNRREALKLTTLEVDAKSGMQEGYASKLENYQRSFGRGVGPDTLPLWLGALRLGIILVELPRATRNFQSLAKAPIGAGG